MAKPKPPVLLIVSCCFLFFLLLSSVVSYGLRGSQYRARSLPVRVFGGVLWEFRRACDENDQARHRRKAA